jgi:hypothetical protein
MTTDFYKKNDGGHIETYSAAEAFNGDYTISVDRVWGRPLGNKATVKVIRHQGTPDERTEIHTIDLSKAEDLKISMRDGRRTKIASIPAPNMASGATTKNDRQQQVMNKLRAVTDPTNTMEAGFMSDRAAKVTKSEKAPIMDFSWTGRVDALINNGVEMQAKFVVTATGEQKMVLTPIFTSVGTNAKPSVKIEMVPGGGD